MFIMKLVVVVVMAVVDVVNDGNHDLLALTNIIQQVNEDKSQVLSSTKMNRYDQYDYYQYHF